MDTMEREQVVKAITALTEAHTVGQRQIKTLQALVEDLQKLLEAAYDENNDFKDVLTKIKNMPIDFELSDNHKTLMEIRSMAASALKESEAE